MDINKLSAIKIRRRLFIIVALMSIPIYFFSKAGFDTFYIMVPSVFLMQLYLCRALKNTSAFLLLTIYAFLYFIYLIPYFYWGSQLSMWSEFQNKELYLDVCFQFYIFYTALCLANITYPNSDKIWLKTGLDMNIKPAVSKALILITFAIICYLFRFGGENVLNSSNPYTTYMQNLDKSNVLGLLVLMFLALCYFAVKKQKSRNTIVVFMGLMIAYFAISRGFRVMIAPLGFMFILLFLEQKLTVKSIFLLAFVGLVGLGYINALKMNEEFSLKYIFSTDDSFILSHQADELYGAAAANGLIESGEISFWDRIGLQMGLFAQSIIPPSFFPDKMRFPMIIMLHTPTGGGGLFVTGVFVIFGYIGLFIITFLISKLIGFAYSTNNRYWKVLTFFVLMYAPNWFSYDLNVILRFPVIAIILYYILTHLNLKQHKIA